VSFTFPSNERVHKAAGQAWLKRRFQLKLKCMQRRHSKASSRVDFETSFEHELTTNLSMSTGRLRYAGAWDTAAVGLFAKRKIVIYIFCFRA
jgi:hypothetical protein